MTTTYPRRSSYGIFVRFRQSRLSLRRGITDLQDALAIAEQLRANRFHDRGEIFVMKEPEGILVEAEPAPTVPPLDPVSPAPPPVVITAVRPCAPAGDEEGTSRPLHRERASVLRLSEKLDEMRRAIDRSHAALARFERAFAAAESLLQARRESLPDAFRNNHQRLDALRTSAASSVASFEQIAVVLERRLESALADATAQPRASAL